MIRKLVATDNDTGTALLRLVLGVIVAGGPIPDEAPLHLHQTDRSTLKRLAAKE